MFTRANECQDINVGDPDCPMERLKDEFGVGIVILHLNAWQFLSSALISGKDRDIIFRVNFPGAAWRSLVDTYSLKTQGASLALLQKLDSVRIGTNDDPTLKLLEMEDIARSFRSSHSQWQHLTESYAIGKFVNALPREYDIQKQMLEERKASSLARLSYPQCRSGSTHSCISSCAAPSQSQGKIKPSRSPAGVRITPDAVDLVTAVEIQADHRAAAEMAARAAEVPRVGELAAAAVAPRPRSPGGGRAGCARAISITSVTAPNRSARGAAREAAT